MVSELNRSEDKAFPLLVLKNNYGAQIARGDSEVAVTSNDHSKARTRVQIRGK